MTVAAIHLLKLVSIVQRCKGEYFILFQGRSQYCLNLNDD